MHPTLTFHRGGVPCLPPATPVAVSVGRLQPLPRRGDQRGQSLQSSLKALERGPEAAACDGRGFTTTSSTSGHDGVGTLPYMLISTGTLQTHRSLDLIQGFLSSPLLQHTNLATPTATRKPPRPKTHDVFLFSLRYPTQATTLFRGSLQCRPFIPWPHVPSPPLSFALYKLLAYEPVSTSLLNPLLQPPLLRLRPIPS